MHISCFSGNFQQFTNAEDDNVRNNATFGIGVLVACGGVTGASLINEALSSLPLNENKNMQVKDNVTGAISRMFLVAEPAQRNELAQQEFQNTPGIKELVALASILGGLDKPSTC